MEVTVEIHCSACGSANYSLPEGGDDGLIGCNDCGARLGTLAQLRSEMMALAQAQSAEARRRDLPGLA